MCSCLSNREAGGRRYAYKMGTNFGISRIRMRERKKSRNISVGGGVSRDHVKGDPVPRGEPSCPKDFHGGFLPYYLSELHSQTECQIQRGGTVAVFCRQVIRWQPVAAAAATAGVIPFVGDQRSFVGGRRTASDKHELGNGLRLFHKNRRSIRPIPKLSLPSLILFSLFH